MKYNFLIFLLVTLHFSSQKSLTPFEKGNGNQTVTYQECIKFYEELDKIYPSILIKQMGLTDSGKPLHLILFSSTNNFDFNTQKTILINNGIHPGEPDGIDASMMFVRDLAEKKIKINPKIIIAIIPIYNIGGALNRNSTSRANQNGPESYGFRGNGRNFDLNRDFIKSDTKNSRSFQEIFHLTQPIVFLDNHVSNGADYQHTFTCVATHKERLGKKLGDYFNSQMFPEIINLMKKKNIDVIPYVNIHGSTPDNGYQQFDDIPRYSSGYTSLFNTIGFIPETHMLKDYKSRVKSTYEFMESVLQFSNQNLEQIVEKKAENLKQYTSGADYPLLWKIDSTKVDYINFKGYEAGYKKSVVTQKDRLYYDKTKPFTKKIPFYNSHKGKNVIKIPKYYIVPQSQWEVIELLKLNKIKMITIKNDTLIDVESYKIDKFQTNTRPFEGHYLHYDTKVKAEFKKIEFLKDDFLVSTLQDGVKYLLETLEPIAVDSFFNWNFFDTILQQKEYFSDYVFEDTAAKMLNENPKLRTEFEEKKKTDEKFRESTDAQLDWLYKRSDYYERAHMQYPIFRIN